MKYQSSIHTFLLYMCGEWMKFANQFGVFLIYYYFFFSLGWWNDINKFWCDHLLFIFYQSWTGLMWYLSKCGSPTKSIRKRINLKENKNDSSSHQINLWCLISCCLLLFYYKTSEPFCDNISDSLSYSTTVIRLVFWRFLGDQFNICESLIYMLSTWKQYCYAQLLRSSF